MTVARRRKSDGKKGVSCAPFFVAVAIVILIIVAVLLALVIANALHITSIPLLIA